MKSLAIIGLGDQTRSQLIPALRLLTQTPSVVALCDTNAAALQEVATEFPNASLYTDYNDLFEQEQSLDAVLVCVPHFLYFDICSLALRKGIPVIKEKPFAMNVLEATNLLTLIKQSKTPVYTLTKRRFFDSYLLAQEWLPKIGVVYQYGAYHYISAGNLFEGWRSDSHRAGGGVFGDMGYHLLDVLIRLFGPVSEATLSATHAGRPDKNYLVEDAASALLIHSNGVTGTFQLACLCGPKDERIEIRGSEGAISATKNSIKLYTVQGELVEEQKFNTTGDAATALALSEFFSLDPETLRINEEQNTEVVKAIEMAYKNTL